MANIPEGYSERAVVRQEHVDTSQLDWSRFVHELIEPAKPFVGVSFSL